MLAKDRADTPLSLWARLCPHAETDKKLPTSQTTVPDEHQPVSLSKKKGAVIGRAATYPVIKEARPKSVHFWHQGDRDDESRG